MRMSTQLMTTAEVVALPTASGPGRWGSVTRGEGEVDETTLPALLPHGFGPKDLPD